MTAQILDGKTCSAAILEQVKKDIRQLRRRKKQPGLAVILVGDDPPSLTYVTMKQRCCQNLGIASQVHHLPKTTSEKRIINLIKTLNRDTAVHGILLQLPLPPKFNTKRIISFINPEKDVDGFHPLNIGRLAINTPLFVPCTPLGILNLLRCYDIQIKGENVVIVGCSNVVGKPLGLLLMMCESATVTICHILTRTLKEHTRKADILITAVGKPKLVTADMVQKGAVVVDSGFCRVTDKKTGKISCCGDIDYEQIRKKASAITPVPGGVGPMTIAMLMQNTVKACKTFK